jgi:hypothetical protein
MISPETGRVVGWIDLEGLLNPEQQTHADVLNGIAYDPIDDRLFVTGKLWPTLFEIDLVPSTLPNHADTVSEFRIETAPVFRKLFLTGISLHRSQVRDQLVNLENITGHDFKEFQARRTMIKFRREPHLKSEFVHTLNGSGLALPRIMIAVMENYQQSDGSISIPDVLRHYMNGQDAIKVN